MSNLELHDKVKSAIAQSGFVLEMKIAKMLKDNNLIPYQSVYCSSDESGVEREVDLVATKMVVIEGGQVFFKISLVIQCKWSKSIPWVVFLNNLDNEAEDGLLKTLFLNRNRSFITGLSRDVAEKLSVLSRSPLKVGYGITSGIFDCIGEQGKSNKEKKKDVAYEAYRSVISGSLGVIKLAEEDMKNGFSRQLVHMVIPIIVFDGNLFEASLSDTQELVLNNSNSSVIYHNGSEYAMIRIYNFSGFESTIEALNSDIDTILSSVKSNGLSYLNHKTIGIINRI